RLSRCIEHVPIYAVEPAVIAAPHTLAFDSSVLQGGAPVAAVHRQQSDLALAIAKEHEVFAEDADRQRQILELVREADRVPEPTQVLATRRSRADASQLCIILRNVPA